MILAPAIVTEVVATVALRSVDGLHRIVPLAVVVGGYAISFWLLSLVLRHFELSMTYAVWSAAGTALIAAIGVAAFGEPVNALQVASLVLVVAGVVGSTSWEGANP